MNLYGRDIKIYLIKHDGKGAIQDTLDISESLVSIGDKSWSIGSDLVKIAPSSLSFKIFDQANSIYDWILYNLPQGDGLIPPYVLLQVDGATSFFGTINPDNIKRTDDGKQDFLNFSCQDWSRLLGSVDPTELLRRALPRVVDPTGTLRTSKSKSGTSPQRFYVWYYWVTGALDQLSTVYFDLDQDWLVPGDRVLSNETGLTYDVTSVYRGTNHLGAACNIARLEGFKWTQQTFDLVNLGSTLTGTFVRQASNTVATAFIHAREAFTPDTSNADIKKYTLKVDSVNGIYPGDKLNHITTKANTSYQIRDLDSETNKIIFTEPLSAAINIGDLLELDEESYEYAIFEPFKKIISLAVGAIGGGVDFSRFQPHTFSRPFLSWLPFRGPAGEIISAPNNLQVGLTNIIIKGPDEQYWSGTPETGYTKQPSWIDFVDWTQQLATAPASLMPFETVTYPDYALWPNKPRISYKVWEYSDDRPTEENDTPSGFFIYDYTSMTRYEVMTTRSERHVVLYSQTWNGSVWGTKTEVGGWVGATDMPLCGVAFPDVPGSLLILQKNGHLSLRLGAFAGSSIAAPPALQGGVLVRTPYGVYLIGKKGAYGKVSWELGALKVDSYVPRVALSNNQILKDFRFFETTLTALDANSLYILGNISYIKDTTSDTPETLDEVWLFNLDPDALAAPAIQPEKIADGSYRIARTVRDPLGNRIFGLLGGRLFQVDTTVTDTFERFKPSSSALEMIEQVCISQNAICLPSEGPTIQIVSRNVSEIALPVTLQIKSDSTSRTENFFSAFEVKGSDEETYWYWVPPGSNDPIHELPTIKQGGRPFELSCSDYVTSISQCASLAANYADFYAVPRMGRDIEVIGSGNGPEVYEALKPLQRIKINDENTEWFVAGVSYSLEDPKAKIKLIQAF